MTSEQKILVKGTVPVLKQSGVALTTYFYNRMLTHNPELKNVFNDANQHTGAQPVALAMAVLAYAENIDNSGVLAHAISRIGNKHVSLNIRPEQYTIVGRHLLASINEVLGEAADSELIRAWSAAYGELAAIMTGVESELYSNAALQKGGWSGWRPFVVKQKVQESEEITSFYLYPTDKGAAADFIPGQYITLRLFVPELNVFQPRQYSISCAPNGEYYRISVKKEKGDTLHPAGKVSNLLHEKIQPGDILELAPPAGDFVLDLSKNNPVVFISGGVGLTPFMSMLDYLAGSGTDRPITWIHGCRGYKVHAFKEKVEEFGSRHSTMDIHTFYDKIEHEVQGNFYEGFVDLNKLQEIVRPDADYYLCGPSMFIKKHFEHLLAMGINTEAIHFEEFSPATLAIK
jgi:nitric oxide dioxygenase